MYDFAVVADYHAGILLNAIHAVDQEETQEILSKDVNQSSVLHSTQKPSSDTGNPILGLFQGLFASESEDKGLSLDEDYQRRRKRLLV
jgi:hypothetical protein